eukprot:8425722-Karenia_brevis.AAC.1
MQGLRRPLACRWWPAGSRKPKDARWWPAGLSLAIWEAHTGCRMVLGGRPSGITPTPQGPKSNEINA